jgi:hypothetical protein
VDAKVDHKMRKRWGYEVFEGLNQTLVRNFFKYHYENPDVYCLFKQYAQQMKNSGRRRYSAKAIFERVRWHYDILTTGDDFKINNNYTAMYARLMIVEDNSWMNFFQLRKFMPDPSIPTNDIPPEPAIYEPPKEFAL